MSAKQVVKFAATPTLACSGTDSKEPEEEIDEEENEENQSISRISLSTNETEMKSFNEHIRQEVVSSFSKVS